MYVVVSGPPGSGKTTLARPLAAALGLPVVAKDTIKEALADALGAASVEESRRLGGAAVAVLLAVAAESPAGAVLDCNFRRSFAAAELARLPGPVVEVFCRCPQEVAAERYRSRTRHAVHFDADRTPEDLWHPEVAQPVAGGWPVVEVDTTGPVDVAALAAEVARNPDG